MTKVGYGDLLKVPTLRSGAAPWTPANLTNLRLWLDASDLTTLFQDSAGTTPAMADADPVGRWSDKSGVGNHATQVTAAARPLLKLNIQNGLSVIRADGSNDVMTGIITLPASHTIIALIKLTGGVGEQFGFNFRRTSPLAGPVIFRRGSLTRINDNGATFTYVLPAGFEIVTLSATGGNVTAYRNETSLGVVAQTISAISDLYALFAEFTGNYGAADLAEFIVCGDAISADDRAAAWAYLNGKWAVF